MTTTQPKKIALVVGAGDATGSAVTRRFAREGYAACATRRNAERLQPLLDNIRSTGGEAHGFGSDARDEVQVAELVERVESRIGPIEAFVFNVGANVPSGILEETPRKFRKIWELACYGGFLKAQAVARRMVPRGRGTIIFTGATASTRGAAGFAAFAAAKHGLRALAQSMARELAPANIHVAHIVIDGAIDTAFIRENFPDKYRDKARDGLLAPEHIADAYWALHQQPRDAWTFEMDLRPWMERW